MKQVGEIERGLRRHHMIVNVNHHKNSGLHSGGGTLHRPPIRRRYIVRHHGFGLADAIVGVNAGDVFLALHDGIPKFLPADFMIVVSGSRQGQGFRLRNRGHSGLPRVLSLAPGRIVSDGVELQLEES